MNQPNPVVGYDVVPLHDFVHYSCHFEITKLETSFNQKDKQVHLQINAVLRLQLSDNLPQLVKSEDSFGRILFLQSKAPHVDPCVVDIDTLFAVLGNVNAFRTVALHINLNLELIFVVEYLFWVSDSWIL